MWKEPLPDQCPPSNACEIEDPIFRMTESDSLSEGDLLPYSRLKPDNVRYQSDCIFFGVSFYDSLEGAKAVAQKLAKKNVKTFRYIQKVQMKKEFGVSDNGAKSGHRNVWFYDTFLPESMDVLEVQEC